MTKRVAVTGMGIISSIGNTVEENFQSLITASHGIATVKSIATKHKDEIKVGEIKISNNEFIKQLKLSESNNYSRTALLAEVAVLEAIKDSNIKDINTYKTGLISATSVAGMDMTEKYYHSIFDSVEQQKYVTSHPAGDSTTKIAEKLGINGLVTTISTACSSGANAIMLGTRLIKAGKLDRVVVGGSDCLSKFTINGFKTLMILSETNCKPFDKNRTGLNLGEAAAFLVLESEELALKESKKIHGYVSGYANANDAYHQTASSDTGDGATLTMEKALKVANLIPQQIDYINAHGTATQNNDSSESKAIRRVFGEEVPNLSSTKAFTGHTLAAAGAIEAVYSLLALKHNILFPNLNFESPIDESMIVPVTEVKNAELNHVLSNSFGFGGNCTTLIFSKE